MSRFVILALGLSLLVGLIGAERIRYDNYNIYQVIPRTIKDIQLLEKLDASSDSLLYLNPITAVDKSVNILVAPHKQPDFLNVLYDHGVRYELVEENFQRTLDAELAEEAVSSRAAIYDWTGYHVLDDTYSWLRSLATKYPQQVEVLRGGSTYEGREILGVKVSFKSGNKGVFLEGGIHAREWISPATVTYILNQLLTSTDPTIRAMAEQYDWYVFPHANPDGYVYTHTKDRLWRKTRSRGTSCYGADPNRNWGFHWREIGASSSECSETYAGKSAFSEIETKSFSDFITSLDGKIHTYLAFHSYSQLLLFAYGHTKTKASNHNDLQNIGNVAAAALAKRYGTKYKVGNVYDAIYPASGSSADWVYGTRNVKVSYTFELRPGSSSSNGFVLPAAQIIPTALETLDSLVALLAETRKMGYFN